MTENSHSSKEERIALIAALPCFGMLSLEEIKEIASLMTEASYEPMQHIVKEGDLVDSVYILVEGIAEVTHAVDVKHVLSHEILNYPIAILSRGEAIGLNDTGFFSTDGRRTATVTAMADCHVLVLSISNLHQFLTHHPHTKKAMADATNTLLRIELIKRSLPFVKLSHERIYALAQCVQMLKIPAGTVIFKQGDIGDRCYLIASGHVNISMIDAYNNERHVAYLRTPMLFGEATLMTRAQRNATAIAADDVEVLVLEHKHLTELMESEEHVARMFMTLMVDRSQPLQNPHVSIHPRTTVDGESIVILKNPDNGSYFKLSKEGWCVWQQLNGRHTMQEITMALVNECDVFAPELVSGLISKLAKGNFITQVELHDIAQHVRQSPLRRCFGLARRIFDRRFAFGDADNTISRWYKQGMHRLFSPIGLVLMSFLALSGFVIFPGCFHSTVEAFTSLPKIWMVLLFLMPCTLLSVALHELGHAFAIKYFGYEVHYMGVGWSWLNPMAFTDTSDMWLSPKLPRIIVNLAGIFADLVIAGLSCLLIKLLPLPYIQAFLWVFALYAYIHAFRMLTPMLDSDGYYILMDVLEKPQLRPAAILWLIKEFPACLRNPVLFKQNWPEVIYWLACIVYLVLVTAMTFYVQLFVFNILGIHHNPYVSLIIPVCVALLSSIAIIEDIREQLE